MIHIDLVGLDETQIYETILNCVVHDAQAIIQSSYFYFAFR